VDYNGKSVWRPMTEQLRRSISILAVVGVVAFEAGCSVKTIAVNKIGDALASGSSSSFAKDEDPELVRDAIPFALKTIESLIDQSPKHKGLLYAAASGFTQYGYAFIQQEADYTEAQDLEKANAMRARAKKLYQRAADYGFRGLEVDMPGFRDRLFKDPDAALQKTTKKHVPLLYWTSAAMATAFAVDVTDSELSIRQSSIEKMMRRALALDESWEKGSLHDFFISWEAGHASAGGSMAKAREHFARSKELSKGLRVGPYVSLAESVALAENNKKEFEALLNEALAIDVNKDVDARLANTISQRRAKWLLGRVEELFVE
jgi:predicted anti-sigma-YlaC factor YlaD